MRGKMLTIICFMVLASGLLTFCNKNENPKLKENTPLNFYVPEGWPEPVYSFSNNPLTKEGFELGRKLFFDGRLSKDGNFPCSSCHQQFAAFATFDHDLSHGFNNQFTTRNAPGMFNLAWHKEMHWDGGINHLEVQPLAPLTAPNEMAESIENVIVKLNSDNDYKNLFRKAFGNEEITSKKMLQSLAQYMAMLVSADSKYDRVMRGKAAFNQYEAEGYAVFKAKCASCHKEPLFTDLSFRNNGLNVNSSLKDMGRMRITGNKDDSLKFKVPSLRNLEYTFPYMHDGRFSSPLQVLDHYNEGIQESSTLDPLLKGGLHLSLEEKMSLLEFLKALSDSNFVKNPKLREGS